MNEFCRTLQSNFQGMGCEERRLSSHQCTIRALEFTSQCTYVDDECVDVLFWTMYGSCVGAFVAMVLFVTVVVTVQRCMQTQVWFDNE